jgi:hypothetical protein
MHLGAILRQRWLAWSFRDRSSSRTSGPATRVEIEVRSATTRHVVTVGQVLRWAEGAVISPAERLKRDRLKAMLKAGGTA